ncbi:MAG: hypothetical protein AAFV71_19300 [Cyanobacteria bacterium J06633_8]
MINSWNKPRKISSVIITSSLSILLCLLNIGCRKSGTILNTAPLTPLINSRYSSRNAVQTLIKLKQDNRIDYQQYIEGRHRYNRAASRVNGLITQIIISIQANSQITDNEPFKKQIIEAFADSAKFQTYVETISTPSNTRGGGIADVLEKLNPNKLIPNIISEISTATKAARKANAQQKGIIICELKSLLLPDFDAVETGDNLRKYPDDECARLIETKDFTSDNNSRQYPISPRPSSRVTPSRPSTRPPVGTPSTRPPSGIPTTRPPVGNPPKIDNNPQSKALFS